MRSRVFAFCTALLLVLSACSGGEKAKTFAPRFGVPAPSSCLRSWRVCPSSSWKRLHKDVLPSPRMFPAFQSWSEKTSTAGSFPLALRDL